MHADGGEPQPSLSIELERCTVRPWQLTDATSMAEALNDKSVWLCVRNRIAHPYTLEHARQFLEAMAATQGPPEAFAIVVGGEAVGGVGIHPQGDVYERSAELGFWLARRHWGRGIASEAVGAAIDSAWARLPHLHRIYARCYAHNAGSQAVLRKLGFQQEGRLRQAAFKDGQLVDELAFGLLRPEWEQRRRQQQQQEGSQHGAAG
ncbi:hypothetical protein CHLNCDRAFT_48068 [Chlorella variabilis]|uniref:N-acetyltransferase domain-containing protein n=1 Tax=Chlorella variabilis TaxID=554065 RepID=E1Z231_CHLVA|nr:hypothetical protein CHLNCDRAFT_48068 [Chlorella variabilis]EFN59925.1 hypothetical protein CHLNCDRAFT_48068 [Chlorella variabilis]|eukprot:XP_005852027.1 hypothetical protein CHLNCDRAFT_48068 [Chlorella variabilis]